MAFDKNDMLLYFRLFTWEGHAPDWRQYETPAQTKILFDEVECMGLGGGLLSVSHFLIAFKRLKDSGEIKPVRAPLPLDEEEPTLTADEYYKLPAATVVRRYRDEPAFHAAVDQLITDQKI